MKGNDTAIKTPLFPEYVHKSLSILDNLYCPLTSAAPRRGLSQNPEIQDHPPSPSLDGDKVFPVKLERTPSVWVLRDYGDLLGLLSVIIDPDLLDCERYREA